MTDKTEKIGGHTLYRIRAIRDFDGVKKGSQGGWIENEDNLSHEGNCWVTGKAKVYGNAKVYGDAWVQGDAKVYDNAKISGYAEVGKDAEVRGHAWVTGLDEDYPTQIGGVKKIRGYQWVFFGKHEKNIAWGAILYALFIYGIFIFLPTYLIHFMFG